MLSTTKKIFVYFYNMKKITLFSIFLIFILCSFVFKSKNSSTIVSSTNFSEHIAPIFYTNCTGCHHAGGVGPFSLINYQDAYNMRFAIQTSVLNGEMPPWPPDTNYTRFRHERILSNQEITLIDDWVNNGAPEGDPNLAPTPPIYNTSGPQLGTPDLSLSAPVYSSNAFQNDDYVCFTIPSQLLADKKIRAVEVIPGAPEIVHHCLVYIDTTGNSTIGVENNCMGPVDGLLVGEFAPGSEPIAFPGDQNMAFGMNFPANSNVILAMHYPIGSLGITDSTKVHFYFYPDQINSFRQIEISPILINFNFCIPPNQTKTITQSFQVPLIAPTLSMYGVFPHMHLLGKSIETYALKPNGDTLKLINIPEWDFEWQGVYSFKEMQKIPPGTIVKGAALYDNTSANLHNPNNPPQTVCAGLNTTDEMFVIYYLYTAYMNGDENLNLDSLMQSGLASIGDLNFENQNKVSIYPNPAKNKFTITSKRLSKEIGHIDIYSLDGKLITSIPNKTFSNSEFEMTIDIRESVYFKSGNLYICQVRMLDGTVDYQKLVLH